MLLAAAVCVQASVVMAQPAPAPVTWTLEDVINRAVTQHPSVDAATARVDSARGALRTAGTLANPIGTYWVEHGVAGGLGSGATAASSTELVRETQAYITMPLEPLFQRGPRVKRADEQVKAAEADVQTARRQVALEAARLFFRVSLAQVSLQAAQRNRTGLEQLVTYNRARVSQGTTAEVDLIRAQVELDQIVGTMTLSEVELLRSRAELWAFLGFPQDVPSGFSVIVPDGATTAGLASLAEYETRARQQRAEVVAARARAAAAAADIEYQRRLSVRQVGATVGFKRTLGENSFLGGISIPLPLFDQNRGEVQRATGESLAALKELALAERMVSAEVQGAYGGAQQLGAQIAALRNTAVDRAVEADRITLSAYQQGAATLLQVLDTAQAAAQARLMFYRLLLAQRQSVLELALATGNDPTAIGPFLSGAPGPVALLQSGDKR